MVLQRAAVRGPAAARELAARCDAAIETSTRALWLAAFLPLLVLYAWSMRTSMSDMSPDPVAVAPSAWALAHLGTPVLPHTYWPAKNPWAVTFAHGQVVSNRTPGLVLLAAPFYWIFRSASPWDQYPASIAAALVTAAAMATLALVIAKIASARIALATALIAGTATTTWAVSGTALWPHGPDQFLVAAAMLSLAAGSSARAGLAFACTVLVRPPRAIIAAVTGCAAAIATRSIRPLVTIGLIAGVGLFCSVFYAHHFWHGGLDSGYEAAGGGFVAPFTDISPRAIAAFAGNVVGCLIAPGKGVLTGSPFLLLLLPGLPPAWRRAPQWARSTAIGSVLYLVVVLKANRFSGGETFWGYRYPLGTLTALAPLFVLAWQDWTSKTALRRAAFGAAVVISVTMQAVGAICFRGPYSNTPWSLNYLVSTLSGPHQLFAAVLMSIGVLTAGFIVLHGLRLAAQSKPAKMPDTTAGTRLSLLGNG